MACARSQSEWRAEPGFERRPVQHRPACATLAILPEARGAVACGQGPSAVSCMTKEARADEKEEH